MIDSRLQSGSKDDDKNSSNNDIGTNSHYYRNLGEKGKTTNNTDININNNDKQKSGTKKGHFPTKANTLQQRSKETRRRR